MLLGLRLSVLLLAVLPGVYSASLRILPVGDSITEGIEGSSTKNGYRLALRQRLVTAGHSVDFIGSRASGDNNADNQHEGFGGFHISMITDEMQKDGILRQRPNIVLVHAGTNDNNGGYNGETYDGMPARLGILLDRILCEASDAVVLVALLITNTFHPTETANFNAKIPDVVGERYKKGYKIRVVDHRSVNDLVDALHPNDIGYDAMAQIWADAISKLPASWITPPQSPAAGSSGRAETCAKGKTYWTQAIGGNNVAAGAHVNGDPGEPSSASVGDWKWSPQWRDEGMILIGVGRPGNGTIYADLDGDGRSDYLYVNRTTGGVSAWLNKDKAYYSPVFNGQEIRWGNGNGAGVRFADLTGDGKADYIVLYDDRRMKVWENKGPNGQVWSWNELTDVNNNFAPPGLTTTSVIFGDVDGDGKDDMAIAKSDGTLDFYLARGTIGTSSFSWLACPTRGFWINNPHISLVDLDGKADFLSVDGQGGVKGFLSGYKGNCDISWKPISDGIEKGVALMTAKDGGEFVRLSDFDADGKVDYGIIGKDTGSVNLWTNTGKYIYAPAPLGGYGAGVRLNDLDGDGVDDYFSIGPNSEALAYINKGQSGNNWLWNRQGDSNGLIAAGVGGKRHQVILADLNGDGLDEYLKIDDESGAVHCWLNGGPYGSGWLWQSKGMILLGIGRDGGKGVRFADMNGDGRADYVYLDADGAAYVWLNTGTGNDVASFTRIENNGNPVASGVGGKRQDIHFADINGDGLADYLWVHPEDGKVDLWYNDGRYGTGMAWTPAGTVAAGVGTPGRNIRFGRIAKSGRADFVAIEESTGAFKMWVNGCSQVIGNKTTNAAGCRSAPLPTQTTTEPLPTMTQPPPSTTAVGDLPAPCTRTFTAVPQLESAFPSNPTHCHNKYRLQVAVSEARGALRDFQGILDNNYDAKFNTFVTALRDFQPGRVLSFIEKRGAEFFKCIRYQQKTCCNECGDSTCTSNCASAPECQSKRNYTISCPTQIPRSTPVGPDQPVYYEHANKDGFEKALFDELGVTPAQYRITNYAAYRPRNQLESGVYYWYIPQFNRAASIDNPKDLIDYNAARNYLDNLPAVQADARVSPYEISQNDIADASIVSAAMLRAGVDAMKQVAETADQITEDQRKALIVSLVTAFIFFLPGIGQLASVARLAALARIIRGVSNVGEAGLVVYDATQDPSSLLFLAFDIVRLPQPKNADYQKAAQAARGLNGNTLDSLPTKQQVVKLRNLKNACFFN